MLPGPGDVPRYCYSTSTCNSFIPLLFCGYTLDSSGLTLDDWLNAGEAVRKKRLQRLEPEFRARRLVEVVDLPLPARNGGEILARVEQTLSRRAPAIAATFVGLDRVCARATLPLSGAGRLKAYSKTYATVLLRSLGDFLLRCNRLFRADLGYMRAVF